MIFSEGDLIVLGIMFLVLFLFRRLDKRRKDLEKVRRYSEKVQDQLDQIFQEKAQQMQDLSINFEVQEKTYREILKRVHSAREDLQGREESLNGLMGRLEGFDERINGLYQLTSKVDENMLRLRDESEYVDNLGVRLKEMQKFSTLLEKKIREINGDFSRQNQESLENLKLSLLEEFQSRLDIINDDLARKGGDLESFHQDLLSYRQTSEQLKGETLDSLRNQLAEVENAFQGRMHQAAERGSELEDKVFAELEERIEEKRRSLEDNWFQGMGELRQEVSTRVEEIRTYQESGDQSLENLRNNHSIQLEELEQRIGSMGNVMDELNESVDSIRDSVSEARHDAVDRLSQSMEELQQRIEQELNDKKRDLDEGFEEPLAFRDELIRQLEDMEQRYSSLQGEQEQIREEGNRNILLQLESLQSQLSSAFQEAEQTLNTLKTDQEADRLESRSKVEQELAELGERMTSLRQESIENFHDSVKTQRDQLMESMDSRFREFSEDLSRLSGNMENVRDEVLSAKEESIGNVRQEILRFQDEMAGAVTDRKEQILQEMDQWHQDLSGRMNQFWSGLEDNNLQAQKGLEERILGYESDLNGKYDRFRKLMAELDQYEDNLSDNLSRLEESTAERTDQRLQQFEEDLRSRVHHRGEELEDLLGKWRQNVSQQLQDLENEDLRFRDNLQETLTQEAQEKIESSRQMFTENLEQFSRTSLNQLEQTQSHVTGELEQIQGSVSGDIDTLKGQVFGDLNQIKDQVSGDLSQIKGQVSGEIEEIKQLVSGDVSQLKGQVSSELQEVHSFVSGNLEQVESKVMDELTQARSEVFEELTQVQGKVKADLEEVQSKVSGDLSEVQGRVFGELKEVRTQTLGELEEVQTQVSDELEQVQTKVFGELKQVQTQVSGDLEMIQNQVTGEMELVQTEINSELLNLKNNSRSTSEDIRSEIENSRLGMDGLKEKFTNQMDLYKVWAEQNFSELEESLATFKEKSGSEMAEANSTLQDIEGRIDGLKSQVLESAQARFGSLEQNLEEDLRGREEELRARLAQWEEGFRVELSSLGENTRNDLEQLQGTLSQSMEERISRYQNGLTENYKDLLEQAGQYTDEIDRSLSEGSARIEGFRNNWDAQVDQLKQQTGEFSSSMEAALGELESLKDQYRSQSLEMQQSLNGDIQTLESNVQLQLKDTAAKLSLLSQQLEQDAMSQIESRQGEYEETINGRFDRLDSLTDDLDQLENSLRLSLNDQEERIQGEIEEFHHSLQEKQEQEKESSNKRLGDIRRIIGQVEGELNQLKTQAYENVSEKLQLFEDDFFSNLRNREEAMKEGFEQWQKTIDLQMEELSGQAVRSREELERNYQSQFKRKFNEIQSRVLEQMDKFQEQVQGFQDDLVIQIEDNEKNFLTHRQTVKGDLQKIREDSMALFHQEFEQFQQSTQEVLIRQDKEIGIKLDSLTGDIDGNRNELTSLISSSRNDISQWQGRILAQLKNQESEIDRELEDLQEGVNQSIEELRQDFLTQKDSLILASSQERAELRKDLNILAQDAQTLKEELAGKSEQSLSLLQQEGERFILDFQARTGELQVESDERIKGMRQSLQDTRERMDNLQRQLHSQVEEDYGSLAANLEEMGRQQQEFVAQTRIFEQADIMRKALEADLEDLRERTGQLERSRQELAPLEEEYIRLQKAYQDVAERMNHFFSEKQKIDLLDGKVARISNLSEAIDVKLEQIDGTNDTLQEFLVRMRQLEDLHGDILKRYQGLEKKATIVDATTEGVEKNLQFLSHIEKGLKSIGSDLEPMKSDLASIKASNQNLMEEKQSVDKLVSSLTNLEDVMADLEARQQKMEKAREWLASTETRLESIGREAQEKVRLLGSLVEKDSKKGTRKAGSPDMNTREMVIQLARQGWSSEEIARQVKLSRGEVELILELSPPEE